MRKTQKIALSIIGMILALIALSPFYLVLVNVGKTSSDIILSPLSWPTDFNQFIENITGVMNNPNFMFWRSFFNSIIVSVITLTLFSLFASMAAWVLCRNKTWWSNLIYMIFVSAMVIPFQVVMLPLLSVFRIIQDFTGIPMLGNIGGLVFSYMGFGGALSIFIIHGFVKGIPRELEEAAEIDGCSKAGIFFKIIFPLLRPVQMTVVILQGIWIWNDFLLPSMLLGLRGDSRTLPVSVASLIGSFVVQWDLLLSAAFLAMIPFVILFLCAQKFIIKGMISGAIK